MAEKPRRHEAVSGSTESLHGLYDMVPASEELDLAEETAQEQVHSQITAYLAAQERLAAEAFEEPDPDEEQEPED